MTIPEAELAQMKADLWERLRHKEKKIVALEREVEELRRAKLLVASVIRSYEKEIEELRAALRGLLKGTQEHRIAKARAALGTADE